MLLPVMAVLLIVAGVSISTALPATVKPPPVAVVRFPAMTVFFRDERLTADADVAEADAESRVGARLSGRSRRRMRRCR